MRTQSQKNINQCKFHLNKRGTTILSYNFLEAISNSIIFGDKLLHIASLIGEVVVDLLVMNIKLRDL